MKLAISVLVGVALAVTPWVIWGTFGSSASAQAATDPVFVGAGDIALCSGSRDEATAKLLDNISGTVFTTGDNAYENGTATEFANCYGPSWGRHEIKARTYPTAGNHEYYTSGASGYFDYFGAAAGPRDKGYYSYDVGEWHIIALNSNCSVVPCYANSEQLTWLEQDLATHSNQCTLAYFHHPRFSSGSTHGNNTEMGSFWAALYAAGADVVVNGHSHNYERFAPQNPNGVADPAQGIREFVVGTGGGAFHGFGTIRPNSEIRASGTSGVLKLTLHPSSYDWAFVPVAGKTFTDVGNGSCSAAPPSSPYDTTAPAVQPPQQELPTGATLGTSTIPTKISWSATDEDSGVASYELQQKVNGGSFTRSGLPSATSTAKTLQLNPGSTYQYRIRATDGAGNTSDWATGPAFSIEALQEDSAAIVYAGSWTQQALTSAYGGALRYANVKGNSAQLTFTGRNVAWVSTKAPNMGKATVAVDGVVVKTVDLYSSTTLPRKVIFSRSNLDPGVSHTVAVQVTGTKQSASSGTRVDVDAFAVLR